MVNKELDFSRLVVNESNLQNYPEADNTSYRILRDIYSKLLNNIINPLANQGLSGDKLSFVIILLERILRNRDIIFDQNKALEERIIALEKQVLEIKERELEPIIQAENRITEELKLFETGFQDWNSKFEKIFENWDSDFKTFEENFNKLENYLNNFTDY